ncbi:MAG: hypothetical protein AB1589_22020 [Cyanobacteriota bacterium]
MTILLDTEEVRSLLCVCNNNLSVGNKSFCILGEGIERSLSTYRVCYLPAVNQRHGS